MLQKFGVGSSEFGKLSNELILSIVCSELITLNHELWFLRQGEVAERLKAPLSKSGSPERRRGFGDPA